MRRISLALLSALACLWPALAGATIAIDPTNAAVNIGCNNNSGPITSCQTSTNFTAAQSNELLVFLAACGQSTNTSATVTSVSDNGPGLAWTKRTDQTSGHNHQSVWTAQASGAFSAAKVTANFSNCTTADAIVAVFGVQGANSTTPWDSNAALPAKTTGTSTTTTAGPITTSQQNALLLSFVNNFSNVAAPSGWTHVPGAGNLSNLGGCCFSAGQIDYKIVSATQSAVTITYSGTHTFLTIGDAIDDASQPAAASTGMMLKSGPW